MTNNNGRKVDGESKESKVVSDVHMDEWSWLRLTTFQTYPLNLVT